MSRIIIKQKDGLYACWSTIIEDFVAANMTDKEFIEFRAMEEYNNKKEELEEYFKTGKNVHAIDKAKEKKLLKYLSKSRAGQD